MPKRSKPLPLNASEDAAIVHGYLKGRLGTPGYQKRGPKQYDSEGTLDVRQNAKRIGVDIRKPRQEAKRTSNAANQFHTVERLTEANRNPATAKSNAAKARRENRGRK
jgi:hypothetical protein